MAREAPAPAKEKGWKDLPEAKSFKWTSIGQRFEGTVLQLKKSSKYKDGHLLKMRRTTDGQVYIVGAPMRLAQAVEDNDLIGKEVRITFTDTEETRSGTLKHFNIRVKDDDDDAGSGSDDDDGTDFPGPDDTD